MTAMSGRFGASSLFLMGRKGKSADPAYVNHGLQRALIRRLAAYGEYKRRIARAAEVRDAEVTSGVGKGGLRRRGGPAARLFVFSPETFSRGAPTASAAA